MVLFIKIKILRQLLTVMLVLCFFSSSRAQSSFENLIQNIDLYAPPFDLEGIPKKDTISIELHNKIFLNYPRNPEKIRPFFYGIDSTMKSDGNVGRLNISFSYLDHLDQEAIYYNKVFPLGRLSLSSDYFSVVIRKEVFDFISVGLYNFNKEGVLLSAIKLFEYSREPISEGGGVQYTLIQSSINQENIIHQRTEADFIIDRKFVLDDDGHFRVIAEEIKDFE